MIYDIHSPLTITDDAFVTFSGNQGWSLATITNDSDSADNVTIENDDNSGNDLKIGSYSPNGIVLKPGKSITLGTGDRGIDNIKVTAGASCTCYIVAVKNFEIING